MAQKQNNIILFIIIILLLILVVYLFYELRITDIQRKIQQTPSTVLNDSKKYMHSFNNQNSQVIDLLKK